MTNLDSVLKSKHITLLKKCQYSQRYGFSSSHVYRASLVAQMVKNLIPMWETPVRSLSWEYSLEKEKATHPIFWPGEFHGLYSPWGRKELDTTE